MQIIFHDRAQSCMKGVGLKYVNKLEGKLFSFVSIRYLLNINDKEEY